MKRQFLRNKILYIYTGKNYRDKTMAIDIVSKLNFAGLGRVSSPATGAVQRATNPQINTTTYQAIENLDKTYGQSPVTTGSGIGDVFDSNRWLGL